MEEGIVIQNQQLPNKIEDLAKFVLVGREKLVSVRAEIRAINKLELAEEVREQKREEAQMLAEALIDAEVKIGDLLKQIPKATKGNQYTGKMVSDSGVDNQKPKKQVIEELGFNQKQAERFETMASNKDIVEQVKAEARENEDIPTRTRVLQLVKEKSKEEIDHEFLQAQFKEIERIKGTEIRMNEAIFKILTVEVNEENVQIWIDGLDEIDRKNLNERLDEIMKKYDFIKEMWLKNNQIRRIK